jgi:hypothetical protein
MTPTLPTNTGAEAPSMRQRRSEYDVTNTVQVSSPAAVRDAVHALFQQTYPEGAFDILWVAFHDFQRLFDGAGYGDYLGCDTIYHDRQHTLDMTLAMGRLIAGYERSCPAADRLGEERALVGLIAALFHDAGYIRRRSETSILNGAEFTGHHVSRSAGFLGRYLPRIGLGEHAAEAMKIVHFTGYEMNIDDIELENPRDTQLGYLLGSADLMAQMADRCYLEKCRDRLYAEFVLAGVATRPVPDASRIQYQSGNDLLRQTPGFFHASAMDRLERKFHRAYTHVEPLFGGRNPYMAAIEHNLAFLDGVIRDEAWQQLRRQPPCFTALDRPLEYVSGLVTRYLIRHRAGLAAARA